MPLDFPATTCGFHKGMGGASNAAGGGDYHYVLFGRDGHAVYFEYDDQIYGGVDRVVGVEVASARVVFALSDGNTVTVRKRMEDAKWAEWTAGIRGTFPPAIVAEA